MTRVAAVIGTGLALGLWAARVERRDAASSVWAETSGGGTAAAATAFPRFDVAPPAILSSARPPDLSPVEPIRPPLPPLSATPATALSVGTSSSPPSEPRPAATGPTAAEDFVLFSNRDAGDALPTGRTSSTQEPTVAASGGVVFLTGNWFAALSTDGGQTFGYVDPYTGPFVPPVTRRFCCDQKVVYVPGRNAFLWLQQFDADASGDTQRINVDRNADGSWDCSYDFDAQMLGRPSGEWLDFPDLVVGANFLYHTSNIYHQDGVCTAGKCTTGPVGRPCSFDRLCDTFAATVVSRYPLDQLSACGLMDYQSVLVTDRSSFRATAGAGATMYWGSHNSSSSIRIYSWTEGEDDYSTDDVDVVPWNNARPTCPGADGTDWCRSSDSRLLGAYDADGVIGFMWNASQGGDYPYPHVQVARFRESDRAFLDQTPIWSPSWPLLYPSVGVNGRGHLGGTIFGGNPPFCAAWIADDVNDGKFAPLEYQVVASSTNGPSRNRWGDYVSSAPHGSFPNTWVASCYSLQGGGGNTNARPRYVHFGRERDSPPPTTTTTTSTTLLPQLPPCAGQLDCGNGQCCPPDQVCVSGGCCPAGAPVRCGPVCCANVRVRRDCPASCGPLVQACQDTCHGARGKIRKCRKHCQRSIVRRCKQTLTCA